MITPSAVQAPNGRARAIAAFIEKLLESGLVQPEVVAHVQAGLPPLLRSDVSAFANALIRADHLTEYQANELKNGRAKGFVLGNYVILRSLGEGGMGKVFLARQKRLKRDVALKVLPPATARNAEASRRFSIEAEAIARLHHPNIAAAYDAGEHKGIQFLALEYVPGIDLWSELQSKGRLFPVDAAAAMAGVAHGLAYAHRQGVIHRDIKPANLMRAADGTIKILDMGLARLIQPTPEGQSPAIGGDHESNTVLSGSILGTPDYISPEQALGQAVDWRCDLYSLGCTLFHLVAGRTPFDGETVTEKLHAHAMEAVPSLADYAPHAPPRLVALCAHLMAKAPSDRPASAEAAAMELEAIARQGLAAPPRCAAASTRLDDGVAQFRQKIRLEGNSQNGISFLTRARVLKAMSDWNTWRPYLAAATALAALAAVHQRSSAPPVQDHAQTTVTPPAAPTQEVRLQAVLRQLAKDNPWLVDNVGIDGTIPHEAEFGHDGLLRLRLPSDALDDLRALAELPAVRRLEMVPRDGKRGTVFDLTSLAKLRPRALVLSGNPLVRDLRPLAAMPLEELDLAGTGVIDLSPLAGMPLRRLSLIRTPVTDLTPLAKCSALRELDIIGVGAPDLTPLEGTPLERLNADAAALNSPSLSRLHRLRTANGHPR